MIAESLLFTSKQKLVHFSIPTQRSEFLVRNCEMFILSYCVVNACVSKYCMHPVQSCSSVKHYYSQVAPNDLKMEANERYSLIWTKFPPICSVLRPVVVFCFRFSANFFDGNRGSLCYHTLNGQYLLVKMSELAENGRE